MEHTVSRPADMPIHYHIEMAKKSKSALTLLAQREQWRKMPRIAYFDPYVPNVDHAGWFVDRTNPEKPVSILFTKEVQDALRPYVFDLLKAQ